MAPPTNPTTRKDDRSHRLRHWLLQDADQVPTPALGTVQPASAIESAAPSDTATRTGPAEAPVHQQSWWKVMCLTAWTTSPPWATSPGSPRWPPASSRRWPPSCSCC